MKVVKNDNTSTAGSIQLSEPPMTLTVSVMPAALLIARAAAALIETFSMFTENQSAQCRGEWSPYDNGNFQAILLKYKLRQQDIQELESLLSPPIARL